MPLTSSDLGLLRYYYERCFGRSPWSRFDEDVQEKPEVRFLTMNGSFRLGYTFTPRTYYVWFVGTIPECRGCGGASKLRAIEYEALRRDGFHFVRAKCDADYPGGLRILEKEGFELKHSNIYVKKL
jgi:GNAT superfamily N-acetyltransferase